MSYKYQDLISSLVSESTNPAINETVRIDAAKKLVGKFLQSSLSADDTMCLVDWLSAGMQRLKGSGRLPPRYADIVLTDYVVEHLATLFRLMGERLETVAFIGSSSRERRKADELIRDHFLNDKEDEVYKSICTDNLDSLIDLIEKVSNGHDFLLGKQATQMFNHPKTSHLDVPVYMMGQLLRAISRRLAELTKYTPPMP